MGFSNNVAEKSLFFSNPKTTDNAVAWIKQHRTDEDFEEQLFIIKGKDEDKVQRTEEEIRAEAKILSKRLRENRIAKEQALAYDQEKNRIKADKELAKANELSKEAQYKRDVMIMKMEKKEYDQD
jgi:hypothetical protein